MSDIVILGIHVLDRIKEAGKTQKTLSQHRSVLKTRLGFHELNDYVCSRNALIIIELKGTDNERTALIDDLHKIGGIEVKKMVFKP